MLLTHGFSFLCSYWGLGLLYHQTLLGTSSDHLPYLRSAEKKREKINFKKFHESFGTLLESF